MNLRAQFGKKLLIALFAAAVFTIVAAIGILEVPDGVVSDACYQQEQATDGMLTIRSPLRYRYKPTIRYRVELYRQPEHAIGVMHASFRTQNQSLIDEAERFFELWSQAECANGLCMREDYKVADGCWDRRFRIKAGQEASAQEIGAAIGQYIKRVDSALKAYFAALPDHDAAGDAVMQYFSK